MAALRIKGVIEPVACPRSQPEQAAPDVEQPDEAVPPATLEQVVLGVDMRYGDAPPNTAYAEYIARTPSYAYNRYLRVLPFGLLLFVFAAASVPEQITRWYVQIPVIILLIGNGLICWAVTRDWDSDSRFVGFGGPAVLPAVLALAVVFGFVRFG